MGSKLSKLLILVVIMLVIPMVAGQTSQPNIISEPVYTLNENATIRLPCTIDGRYCNENVTCFATIINPDADIIHNNASMFRNNAVFEINVTDSDHDTNGEYQFNVACSDDAGSSVSRFLNYDVTPSGEKVTTGKGMLYISLLLILVVLFVLTLIGGFKSEQIVMGSAFWLSSYLIFVALTFIAWNISADFITTSPYLTAFFRMLFIVASIGLFPVMLILTFYTVYMMIQIKSIQKMIDKGIPSDEAYERTVKSGLNWRKF